MASAAPDYFPLRRGLTLEYRTKGAGGSGLLRVEVLSVKPRPGGAEARCRRTTVWEGKAAATEFTAVKDAGGVRCSGVLELVLPPRLGARWSREPHDYSIDALDAVTTVPAGTYRGCLLVSWRVAGGDGGQGERYYAPGIGLVRELSAEETDPYEHALARIL